VNDRHLQKKRGGGGGRETSASVIRVARKVNAGSEPKRKPML